MGGRQAALLHFAPRGALPGLLAPALFALASFGGLSGEAAAQGINSLKAHLGFLRNKPKSFPLTLPRLRLKRGSEGTYAVIVSRNATGITLVARVDLQSRVSVKQYSARGGKKRKRNSLSTVSGRDRFSILSFDGLGPRESMIRISLKAKGNPAREASYDIAVTRVATMEAIRR